VLYSSWVWRTNATAGDAVLLKVAGGVRRAGRLTHRARALRIAAHRGRPPHAHLALRALVHAAEDGHAGRAGLGVINRFERAAVSEPTERDEAEVAAATW